VRERPIEIGLSSGGLVEIRKGLIEGDRVIARAGTFLKDGDVVRPIETDTRAVSDAR
jgi:multidrug efflux pump subunit AcrA (membrane-fusion protein)